MAVKHQIRGDASTWHAVSIGLRPGAMPDAESQFLDALYLGVRDLAEFDHALTLLCGLFDVNSAVLIDFDAARPEVSAQSAIGLFSGEVVERYEREFADLDPAPPAFMKQPVGTAIPTYRLLPGGDAPARRVLRRVFSAART